MRPVVPPILLFFFFNDTATTEIYTLSLHDALPICFAERSQFRIPGLLKRCTRLDPFRDASNGFLGQPIALKRHVRRSEEHTSELQSRSDLVCRLLLEKKKNSMNIEIIVTQRSTHPD